MGCDIHMAVEGKYPDSNYWFLLGAFRGERDYGLFARMNTTVRNYEGIKGFAERGIPEDSNFHNDEMYANQYLGDDSYSWLSRAEFKEILSVYRNADRLFDYKVDYKAILKFMEAFELHNYQTRLLFGFDS